jgi:hypothetical protein
MFLCQLSSHICFHIATHRAELSEKLNEFWKAQSEKVLRESL